MHNYQRIRRELEAFLPSVGERVLELRRTAEKDPKFTQQKKDGTLRSKGDTASQRLIWQWIEDHFPGDSIKAEEKSREKIAGPHTWIVDPIDGTYNYVEFNAKFSISVGLVESNIPRVGVLYFPAEKVTISAAEGKGAWMNDQPLILFEGKTSLSRAFINGVNTVRFADYFAQPHFKLPLEQQSRLPMQQLPLPGVEASFTFTFWKMLEGHTDAIMHPGAMPYDIAAMSAIARELKWPVSGYCGEPIDFTPKYIPVVISRSTPLYHKIIRKMNPS